VAVAAIALGARAAEAQRSVRFGVNMSFASDDRNFGLGARVNVDLEQVARWKNFEGVGSFDYFFPSSKGQPIDVNYWELNANGLYKITSVKGSVLPYVGSGLNVAHGSGPALGYGGGSTELGLNLLGGVRFKINNARITPFA